jgi:hypothetical protein
MPNLGLKIGSIEIYSTSRTNTRNQTYSLTTNTPCADLGEKIVIDATSDQSTPSNLPGVIAFSAIGAALLGLGAFAVIRSRKAKAAPAVVDQFPTE